jgi:hypothetical protein
MICPKILHDDSNENGLEIYYTDKGKKKKKLKNILWYCMTVGSNLL